MPDLKVFNIVKIATLLLLWASFAVPVRAQMPSVRVSVENFAADTGAVWFDVFLEQGSQNETYLANAQVVFTLDTSVFNFGGHQADSLHLIKTGYASMLDFFNDPYSSPFWVSWGKRNNQNRINLYANANLVSNTSQLQTLAAYLGANGRQCVGRLVLEGYQGGVVNLNYAKRQGASFNNLVTDVFSFESSAFDQERALVEYHPIPPMGAVRVDGHVFLEGPFLSSAGEMDTQLNLLNYLPLAQPYNMAPFNYNGSEAVAAMPDSVVDWVLIEVRKAANASLAATDTTLSLGYRAALLTRSGHLIDTSFQHGILYADANLQAGDSLYLIIRHRNHLAAMAGVGLMRDAYGRYSMDLRYSSSNYYAMEAKELSPGVYGMASGDLNHDGRVQAGDRALLGALFTPAAGYYVGDIDMDGVKDEHDVDFLLNSWAYVIGFALK